MANGAILSALAGGPRIAEKNRARAQEQRIATDFQQGQADRERAATARTTAGSILGGQFTPESQQAQLASADPALALKVFEAAGIPANAPQLRQQFAQTLQLANAQAIAGNTDGAAEAINGFKAQMQGFGVNTQGIDSMLQAAQQNPQLIPGLVQSFEATGLIKAQPQAAGFSLSEGQTRFDAAGNPIAVGAPKTQDGRGTLSQVQSSQILPNGSTVQVFKDGSTRVTGPEGGVLKGADRADAVIAAQEFGIDVQSRRAGGREGATGVEKRASELIVRGTAAAESTATIRRALTLLDAVKTGGIAAVSLATRQRLGIEGADEGELSNSLGKSVLSQLRETFGAAFTQTEGERLERIEAGFGKSTETNRRLLGQALRIAEKVAKRARRAALERGNDAEVADIDDLLSFSLGIDDLPAGLPTGTVDNGDGTFTLANGDVVRRK